MELIRFGAIELNVRAAELRKHGVRIGLPEQSFQILLMLVQRPGDVVLRDEIRKQLWPGDTVVEFDHSINAAVQKLRDALGESAREPRYIETVARRGYRFIGAIDAPDPQPEPPVTKSGIPQPADMDSVGREPAKAAENRSADRNRFKVKPISVVVLVAVLFGAGAWLYLRIRKNVEIDRLDFKGNFHLGNWNEDEVRKGMEYYSTMIALDPNSASGYHGLANGWLFLSDVHVAPREAMPKAKAAAAKALQMDEKSPLAHLSLAVIKTQYDWDWAGAELEFQRAIQLDPKLNAAHQLYGWYFVALGRYDKAQTEMKRMQEIDAFDDFILWGSGLTLYFEGRCEQSVEQYRRAIAVEPRSYWPHMLLGWAYEEQNRFTDAISELQKSALLIDNNPQVLASLGHVYARSGQGAAARRAIAELQETAKRRYVSPYDIATIFAGLGDNEQALAWLERAYEDRSGWLAWWLKVDPKFVALRSDPRFHDLLRRIGHA